MNVTVSVGGGVSIGVSFPVTIVNTASGTFPTAAQTLLGVIFGPNDNDYTGTITQASVGDVRSGTTYGPSLSLTGTLVTVTPSGIFYKRPLLTNQTTSYNNYDDGWQLANNNYDYTGPTNPIYVAELDSNDATPGLTLKNNNAFGNTNRFTDSAGGQTYANGYVIDHRSGLGYYYISTGTDWATQLSYADGSSDVGYSDWRMANFNELLSIVGFEAIGWYAPCVTAGFTTNATFTSTTYPAGTTSVFQFSPTTNSIATVAKSGSRRMLMVRNHY